MISNVAAPFEYHAPDTVEEVSRLLTKYGGAAKILAGGHSLVPLMKLRLVEPEALIDLRKVAELSGIRAERGGLRIGAMTTYYEIESSAEARRLAPVLAEAAAKVADVQVRNFGTIGGSLSHADPAGDMPAVVLALGAELEARSARASRTILAERFFTGFLTTALRTNEVLTAVHIPALPPRTGAAYAKLANKASHYAVVGVAAVLTLDAGGVCTAARVGVTGAGPHASRARRTERILTGRELTPAVIRRAAERAGAELAGEFNNDIHASAEYREEMTKVFAERAIEQAAARAR
jgi:carbon-monoxide dehydrogenase medium subunit